MAEKGALPRNGVAAANQPTCQHLLHGITHQVGAGEVDLAGLEDPNLSSEDLYQKLLRLPGMGC